MRKVYRGADIEVSFDLALCIHIGECLRGQGRVFNAHRRPWVLPNEADAGVVADVVERCPSGALLYSRRDGGREERHDETTVTPMRDGPLLVVGEVNVTRPDGTRQTLPRATLCRCGFSKHKPFCDNQHLAVGFRAPGQPFVIHTSEVRPRPKAPISKSEDPRRLS